jgi:lysozyme
MNINQATVDLVKRWEGFKATAYLCPAGVWTIGYGTTSRAGICVTVTKGMTTTERQAEEWLRKGLDKFAAQIRPAITATINDNQFGAFLSLAYNIGPAAFRGSSALRHFNAGDTAKAAAAIKLWNKATVNGKRQVLQGLVNRREDEVRLFNTPASVRVIASLPNNPLPATLPPSRWAAIGRAIATLFRGRK